MLNAAFIVAGSMVSNKLKSEICESVARGFLSFHDEIRNKVQEVNDTRCGQIYDDLPSKLGAWRRAVQFVKLSLSLGFEIVTGVSETMADF